MRDLSRALEVPEESADLVNLSRADPLTLAGIVRGGVLVVDCGGLDPVMREKASRASVALEDYRYFIGRFLAEDPGLNRELLASRLDEVMRDASFIRQYLGSDPNVLEGDMERAYALERALHRLIEAMLDACRHVVSAMGLGLPRYYSEYPQRLAEAGLMDPRLVDSLSRYARLRNILVHRYVEIDYRQLLDAARDLVSGVVPSFVEWLRGLITRERGLKRG